MKLLFPVISWETWEIIDFLHLDMGKTIFGFWTDRQKQTPANDLMGLWENLYFSRVILYTKLLNWSINLVSSSIFACVKGRHGGHYKECKQEQCVSLFSWWYFGVWQQRGEKEDQDERLHHSASPQQPKASQGECTVAGNRPTTTGEWFT